MKKLTLLCGSIVLLLTFITQPVQAHVFIKDTTDHRGAILHINPNDDPVAGDTTEAFYDIQAASDLTNIRNASLVIIDASGKTSTVPVSISDTNVRGTYIFPERGIYQLVLTLKTSAKTFTFSYDQRVSRGTGTSNPDQSREAKWVTPGVIFSTIGLLVLCILVVNNRHDIIRRSQF